MLVFLQQLGLHETTNGRRVTVRVLVVTGSSLFSYFKKDEMKISLAYDITAPI